MKKDEMGQLILAILLPIAVGSISGAIYGNIVWTVLYLFMGISSYLVYKSHSQCRELAEIVYGVQLLLNFSFCIVTFRFSYLFFGLILSILLLFSILLMSLLFNKGSKTAAILQIPYLLWLCYVVYLEISILM